MPTVREAGLPGFDLLPWTGLMVRAGTAPAIVASMNAAVEAGLSHPDTAKRMAELNFKPLHSTPESFRAMIADEQARWRAVAKEVDLKLD